ncbi:DoxX family protein [Gramella sp. GC03-9]|uniref:DoxX family protein n=1 Tax=Christiangramia oceanisediminis TaxID=2920386 RepID=A0A9X2KY13_9FLAO|nr:DoxX family protein [Gramella oceanisediminis]MCP9200385.1 DoxX family protein [Gramella oceanisediminis]
MKNSYSTNLNLFRTDLGLLLFRIFIGGLMLTHGWSKLLRFFGPDEISFADPLGFGETFTFAFAVFAEFFCSIFIIFGFLTRISSIPLFITMLTAALIVHIPDGFGKQELPLLYASGFLLLFLTGPGKYSLDFKLYKKK